MTASSRPGPAGGQQARRIWAPGSGLISKCLQTSTLRYSGPESRLATTGSARDGCRCWSWMTDCQAAPRLWTLDVRLWTLDPKLPAHPAGSLIPARAGLPRASTTSALFLGIYSLSDRCWIGVG